MPPLSESTASHFVKLMYIGDSGTGKTGSLASLAAAGYKLRLVLKWLRTLLHQTLTAMRAALNTESALNPAS